MYQWWLLRNPVAVWRLSGLANGAYDALFWSFFFYAVLGLFSSLLILPFDIHLRKVHVSFLAMEFCIFLRYFKRFRAGFSSPGW